MSVTLMAKVWGMPIPSTPKLVLLSLSDHANDKGENCWPSQPTIATRCSLSLRAVRYQITWLEERKIIRRNVKVGIGTVFTITLDEYAEPRHDVPPRQIMPPHEPRHDVPPTPANYAGNPGTTCHQIIKEPSITTKKVFSPTGKAKKKSSEFTLQAFLDSCNASGETAIPENDPIFAYAEKAGIDSQMLSVCWEEFKAAFLPDTAKRQKDWRAHFRNAVRRNWYKLWFLKEGEAAQWTTAGEQARRAAA